MAISVKEAAIYFALAESERRGKKVAVRFKADGEITGIGVDDSRGVTDARTAIINVLQNSRSGNFIATSYVVKIYDPNVADTDTDELSLGMCIMQRINTIFFRDGSVLKFLKSADGKNPPWEDRVFDAQGSDKVVDLNSPEAGDTALGWLNKIAANPPATTPATDPNSAAANASRMYGTFTDTARSNHYTDFPALTLPAGLPHPAARVDNAQRHEIFNKLAWAIVGEAAAQRGPGKRFPDGHHIGSVLRGPNDQILGWGINTGSGSGNSTLHGEVNLILNYREQIEGAAIGDGQAKAEKPILYSTLEPCHMCAGLFAGGGDDLQCYYSQADEGIKFNALYRNVNHSEQEDVSNIAGVSKSANRMGRVAGSAYGYEERRLVRENARNKKPAVTAMLNRKIDTGILSAIQDYFDVAPAMGTHERTIWDAGLKLLYHINPGVEAKWKDRNDVYVTGVIP